MPDADSLYKSVDPASDPLWSALDRAASVLKSNWRIVHERETDWVDGLNAAEINRLAKENELRSYLVYGEEVKGDDSLRTVYLCVFHPNGRRVVRLEKRTNGSYEGFRPEAHSEAVGFLLAWRDDREVQLVTQGGKWLVLDVLTEALHSTFVDEQDQKEQVATLTDQLRAAAARRELTPWNADDNAVARAVRTWLVETAGLSGSAAGRTTVEEAIARLRSIDTGSLAPPRLTGTADSAPAASTRRPDTLDLGADGQTLRIGSHELSYEKPDGSRRVSIESDEGKLLLSLARPGQSRAAVRNDARTHLRDALDGVPGRRVVLRGRGPDLRLSAKLLLGPQLRARLGGRV